MDGGHYGMPGPGTFRSRQAFSGRTHLAYADHIRVFPQHTLQKEVLVDVHGRVLMGPCEQVDHRI